MTPIQATILGFSGKPCSLFSAFDESTGILAVSVEAAYRRERREGCLVLTNDKTIDERDSLLNESKLADSIAAFFALESGLAVDGKSPRLVFAERAQRANPKQAIEKDGVDENGVRYRISDAITNAQVACLVTALYAFKTGGMASKVADMAQQLDIAIRLAEGRIFTV